MSGSRRRGCHCAMLRRDFRWKYPPYRFRLCSRPRPPASNGRIRRSSNQPRYDLVNFFRPKSILPLLLTCFLLVALPLIVALGVATVLVDRLVTHGQPAVL